MSSDWTNLENVLLAKISNLQQETKLLREKLVAKEYEMNGLKQAIDEIERFGPKNS